MYPSQSQSMSKVSQGLSVVDSLSLDSHSAFQRPSTLLEKKVDRLHSLLVKNSNKENDPTKLQRSPSRTVKSTLEKVDSITAAVLDLRAANEHYRKVLSIDLTECVQELKGTVDKMKGYFDDWDKLADEHQ